MQFSDYKTEKEKWITFVESNYYPDYIEEAKTEYTPFLEEFKGLLNRANNSKDLLRLIMQQRGSRKRIQLLRVFRRYISPDTSVEMLKIKSKTEKIIEEYSNKFRPIEQVRACFKTDDNVLTCLLREYEDRGSKGYQICENFFGWFTAKFEKEGFSIEGPRGPGGDINLQDVFENYPRARPTDFVIYYNNEPVVVGYIRYDSDRGGSQEDDRPGGYRDVVTEILTYAVTKNVGINILFINDGPGLTLGSMWDDYAFLEKFGKGHVLVATLKMLESRLTKESMLK